jgi:hypothetical protein
MSNHWHVVLHIDNQTAQAWSHQEVATRWHQLFKGTVLTQRYLANSELLKAEREAVELLIGKWRERLMSISWFMRVINESIAREANKEDNCTGHFWDRFFAPAKPAYITSM